MSLSKADLINSLVKYLIEASPIHHEPPQAGQSQ